MKKMILSFVGLLFMNNQILEAAVTLTKVEYKIGDQVFEATIAQDKNIKRKLPGVVVFHNWMGVTKETESKITELAKLGYVAFAADLYGKEVRPKDTQEAGKLAFGLKENRKLLRERVNASLATLRELSYVDSQKIFATGYCFGGTAALELARSGADVLGVVSFHGGLSSPAPADAKMIKSQVLVLHGAIDPFVSEAEIAAFKKEMDEAKVNYQFVSFSQAVHSFTEKAAGEDNAKGAAYNAIADKRSWKLMKDFFAELLAK